MYIKHFSAIILNLFSPAPIKSDFDTTTNFQLSDSDHILDLLWVVNNPAPHKHLKGQQHFNDTIPSLYLTKPCFETGFIKTDN